MSTRDIGSLNWVALSLRFEFRVEMLSINEATRRLAAAYRVPLWDFDAVAATLPNRGLTDDQAHLTVFGRNDYTDPETLQRGYPVSDLSTLVVLDAVRRIAWPVAQFSIKMRWSTRQPPAQTEPGAFRRAWLSRDRAGPQANRRSNIALRERTDNRCRRMADCMPCRKAGEP